MLQLVQDILRDEGTAMPHNKKSEGLKVAREDLWKGFFWRRLVWKPLPPQSCSSTGKASSRELYTYLCLWGCVRRMLVIGVWVSPGNLGRKKNSKWERRWGGWTGWTRAGIEREEKLSSCPTGPPRGAVRVQQAEAGVETQLSFSCSRELQLRGLQQWGIVGSLKNPWEHPT